MNLTIITTKINRCILLSYLILHTSLNAQIEPCINGMAGIYPCNDYDLIHRIPLSVLDNSVEPIIYDVWGWTDALDAKEYAIVGLSESTAFIDITDPENSILLGKINIPSDKTTFTRSIKVYNDHVYIGTGIIGSPGIQIFDLKVLRSGPNADLTYTSSPNDGNVHTFDGDNGLCLNIAINDDKPTAYLLGCMGGANIDGGFIAIDISSPLNPTVVGSWDFSDNGGSINDAQVVNYNGPDTDYIGKEILIACNNGATDKIMIFDVTDKSNITVINELEYQLNVSVNQGWFSEDQRYFFVSDSGDESETKRNTRTIIFDLQDLDVDLNPVFVKQYFGTTPAIDIEGYVNNNKFYLANSTAGLRVLDTSILVSANNTDSEIGYFDTAPNTDTNNFEIGTNAVYPFFSSGHIILANSADPPNGGLFIVRKSGVLNTPSYAINSNSFILYPNPTNSTATINRLGNHKINTIEIYNVLGQKIYKKDDLNEDKFMLSILKKHNKGLYFVRINKSVTKKLIAR